MTEERARSDALDALLGQLRPKLHRYCARMTGSVIDAEDVVQEALLKAVESWPRSLPLANPEGWIFRIAHNAALDFLRRRVREQMRRSDESLEMIIAGKDLLEDREIAAMSLRRFMRLPAPQRGAVILKDVLGYSLEEIGEITGGSLSAAKSALQRGRVRLRELAAEPGDASPPALSKSEHERLAAYVERFNGRDFDAVRRMLAEDVELDLVNRLQARGRDRVGEYFHRYSLVEQWRFAPGIVDGKPAMLAFDRHDASARPSYFVVLTFAGDRVVGIRDFLFARYAMDGADIALMDG